MITDELAAILEEVEHKPVGGADLDSLVNGCVIVGAEPIDYPLTDGAIIYLKEKSGAVLALELGAGPDNGEFYIKLARSDNPRKEV